MNDKQEESMPAEESSGAVRTVTSEQLFGPAREVRIEHQGERYRLRLTRLGKLILTK